MSKKSEPPDLSSDQAFAAIGLIPDGGNHFHMVRALGYKRAFAPTMLASRPRASLRRRSICAQRS